ncbi:MAG: 2-dehydropantoate 2-reductase N-terminal domain-containing protein, partial [Phycisphaerae bacterium]|nr:2-dehydropantoate 2-reductase N-terminal domain-containing protein [Phycisphaerae bacterium]
MPAQSDRLKTLDGAGRGNYREIMANKKLDIVSGVRIAVVGPGAIGTVFAVYLAKAGYNVVLVDHRAERARRLSKRSLVVQVGRRGRLSAKVRVTTRPRGKFELVILAVKAHAVENAAKKMKSWIGDAPVLAIQNGLGVGGIMAKSLPAVPVIVAVTFQAANVVKEGVVKQVANLPTYVGYLGSAPDKCLHSVVAIL